MSAVMFSSCRCISHLHLSEADLGIEMHAGRAFAGMQLRVAVDTHAALPLLAEDLDLARTGVSVDVDLDTTRDDRDEMPRAARRLDVGGRSRRERDPPQVDCELAGSEVVLVLHLRSAQRTFDARTEAALERDVD